MPWGASMSVPLKQNKEGVHWRFASHPVCTSQPSSTLSITQSFLTFWVIKEKEADYIFLHRRCYSPCIRPSNRRTFFELSILTLSLSHSLSHTHTYTHSEQLHRLLLPILQTKRKDEAISEVFAWVSVHGHTSIRHLERSIRAQT